MVVVGPTGSGKTDLSIRLARHFSAPILSTDSRQFYRGIPIGTAQPTPDQLQAAEHHLIASHDLEEGLNCGSYEVLALEILERLFQTHDTVVAVGGSGLYVQALCEGMDDLPEADETIRQALAEKLRAEGLETLTEELRERDPAYWAQVDRQNPARVLRALEVCRSTGRPYSELRTGERRSRNFEIQKVGVDMPREELYERINRRVELMMEQGLEAEARRVYPLRHLNSLQTVGYKELFQYFDGEITREEAVELIKRNSRRYAKRQLTWFRRDEAIRWFHPTQYEEVIAWLEPTE
ncbi:MAG: tRNA (adenosine(37)-N6)-dimethylallyltransferase MiaA [Rikenellaceae bacterium]|nr:tRNA (adenosine(37)-N6)-dimethylallyltransferase MiaA [Rikenellaceae bacterium]